MKSNIEKEVQFFKLYAGCLAGYTVLPFTKP